jgi:enoyl-CoA hydratase/carnithine racemase
LEVWIPGFQPKRDTPKRPPPTPNASQEEAAISDILTSQNGPILEITLNRPQDGNAASDDMAEQLTKLLLGAAGTADIIVLRGAGEDFCVGRSPAGRRPASNSADALERRFGSDVVFDCYNAFRRVPAPVIGVVKGRALGFGCAIAAVCDITLAADSAQFQIPEMLHNIMPTMVMSALVDRVPRKAISYLVYSTAMISAARAREAGLVSEVVPLGQLDAAVEALCATMLKAPQPARLGVKEYTRCALDMDVHGAIDYARNLHATINSAAAMRPKPK